MLRYVTYSLGQLRTRVSKGCPSPCNTPVIDLVIRVNSAYCPRSAVIGSSPLPPTEGPAGLAVGWMHACFLLLCLLGMLSTKPI